MASTVNTAFEEYLKDTVCLDSNQTATATNSRDNLIDNINGFSEDNDFFNLVSNCHLKFGSFARRTKIRLLDDIDLMICISGNGRTYSQSGDTYNITGIVLVKHFCNTSGFLNHKCFYAACLASNGVLYPLYE